MYSAYKLNKQGDNIQPWCTPFPIWNLSLVPYPVLTIASWPAYRFLRRQVRWSVIPISFRIFQSLLLSTQTKVLAQSIKQKMFFWNSWLFNDPIDVDNWIPGSFAFSKSNLNIWTFSVLILLKPGLENFDCYSATMWDECNFAVVWTFFGIAFLWDWNCSVVTIEKRSPEWWWLKDKEGKSLWKQNKGSSEDWSEDLR